MEDEDIWYVSEVSDSEEHTTGADHEQVKEEKKPITREEAEMARYMTERAPGGIRDTRDFDSMHKATKKERK